MITTPTVLYLPLCVPSSSLFQECDDNCVIQFMNIISQMGNESNCWYCLHHPQSSDANSGWVAEPAPERSWYQPKLAYSRPNPPTYPTQPFKAHSYDIMIRPHGALQCPSI